MIRGLSFGQTAKAWLLSSWLRATQRLSTVDVQQFRHMNYTGKWCLGNSWDHLTHSQNWDDSRIIIHQIAVHTKDMCDYIISYIKNHSLFGGFRTWLHIIIGGEKYPSSPFSIETHFHAVAPTIYFFKFIATHLSRSLTLVADIHAVWSVKCELWIHRSSLRKEADFSQSLFCVHLHLSRKKQKSLPHRSAWLTFSSDASLFPLIKCTE